MRNTQYLVSLPGIDAGGKNIIKMADLKAGLEEMGFPNVVTYIRSGNVLFKIDEEDTALLTTRIGKGLSKRLNFEAKVVVISQKELDAIFRDATDGFGNEEKQFRYDVIFLKEPLTSKETLKIVGAREGVATAAAGKPAYYLLRRLSRAPQSHLTKVMSMPVHQDMTIRIWNMTAKLSARMEGQNG